MLVTWDCSMLSLSKKEEILYKVNKKAFDHILYEFK